MVAPLFAVLFILAVAAPIITRWIHQQRGDENESTLMDDGSLNWKVLGGSQGDLIFQVSVATVTAMGVYIVATPIGLALDIFGLYMFGTVGLAFLLLMYVLFGQHYTRGPLNHKAYILAYSCYFTIVVTEGGWVSYGAVLAGTGLDALLSMVRFLPKTK